MNNQEYKVRPEIIKINSNEPLFCPYSLCKVNVVFLMLVKT